MFGLIHFNVLHSLLPSIFTLSEPTQGIDIEGAAFVGLRPYYTRTMTSYTI